MKGYLTRMQITFFDLTIGIIALISMTLNLFQRYKERKTRQEINDQKRLHSTILMSLLKNFDEGTKSHEDLKRKGEHGSTISESIVRIINAQRIALREFLERYYEVEITSAYIDRPENEEMLVEIIEGADSMTAVMTKVVEKADRYVFTIGGRSRNNAYLNALTKRVLLKDIRYIRVITGESIKHLLCEHIHNVFENVELGYLNEDKYGGILVTQDTVVCALYSSKVPILDKALIIQNEKIASDYRSYVQDLLNSSKTKIDDKFITNLCKKCGEKQNPS